MIKLLNDAEFKCAAIGPQHVQALVTQDNTLLDQVRSLAESVDADEYSEWIYKFVYCDIPNKGLYCVSIISLWHPLTATSYRLNNKKSPSSPPKRLFLSDNSQRKNVM